jgi:hypothetical protein
MLTPGGSLVTSIREAQALRALPTADEDIARVFTDAKGRLAAAREAREVGDVAMWCEAVAAHPPFVDYYESR